MDIKSLRSASHNLEPVVRLGKMGLTESAIDELKRQLKKKNLIKIKFLRSCLEKRSIKDFIQEITDQTGAVLVCSVGLTAVFYKK